MYYESPYGEEVEDLDEPRRSLTTERIVIAVIFAGFIIILLLLTGNFLFTYFYGSDSRSDCAHGVERRLHRELAAVNATFEELFIEIDEEILERPDLLVGNTQPPDPIVGTPSSLYFVNQTGVIYFKAGPDDWERVFNASAGLYSCATSCPPIANETYTGPWNSTTVYQSGAIVEYNNTLYYTLENNVTVVQPSPNSTVWLGYIPNIVGPTGPPGPPGPQGPMGPNVTYENTWNTSTPYTPGEVVSVVVNGTTVLYVAATNSTSSDPTTNSTAWLQVLGNLTLPTGPIGPVGPQGPQGQSFVVTGFWNATTNYTTGDIVIYNNTVYITYLTNNYNITPSSNSSAWTNPFAGLVGPAGPDGINATNGQSYQFLNAWNSGITYNPGDTVMYQGAMYTANTSSLGAAPNSSSAWYVALPMVVSPQGPVGPMGPDGTNFTFTGFWNASQSYVPEDFVVTNQTLYVATANSTGVPPYGANSSADWSTVIAPVIGPAGPDGKNGGNGTDGLSYVFEGPWNSTQSYLPGQLVLFQGALWSALNQSTGVSPSTNSSAWQLRIPDLSGGTMGPVGPVGPPGLNASVSVYVGPWQANQTYMYLNVVSYNRSVYEALGNNILGTVPGSANTSSIWGPLLPTVQGPTGAQGAQGPNATDGYGYPFVGPWNASTIYFPFDVVALPDNSLYAATAMNINQYPVSFPADWKVLYGNISGVTGPAGPQGYNALFVGPWNNTNSYTTANIVTYNGFVYQATANNTGIAPGSVNATWTLEIGNITVVGPAGTQGAPGPTSGARTIRILGASVPISNSGGYAPMPFTGTYDYYYDSTSGQTWGNTTLDFGGYPPPTQVVQSVFRSEVSFSINSLGGTMSGALLRIDATGTRLDGTPGTQTVCIASGIGMSLTNPLPTNATYNFVANYVFNYNMLLEQISSTRRGIMTCMSAQVGNDEFFQTSASLGSQAQYTIQQGSITSNVVSGTNVLDLTKQFYFQLTYYFVPFDPNNLCPTNPSYCTLQPLYATHTQETLYGTRTS